jgi:predicted aspartyl protease
MGRIFAPVSIGSLHDREKPIQCDALVDTGASHMVLPAAWREKLGELIELGTIRLQTATQDTVEGTVCGPVQIQIEGFRPIITEVLFVDMKPEEGTYEPLMGYVVLELSMAAVDMTGHGLVHLKHLDLK